MKVIQFVHGYPPEFVGGTETYTRTLSQRLVERGHAVFVVAGSEWPCPEPSITLGEDCGVVTARLIGLPRRKGFRPSAYDPLAEHLVRKVLHWWRPQVAHVHHWSRLTGNLVATCRELKIPAVVTLHDQWIACSRSHRVRPDEVFCADRTPPCASCVDRDAWQPAREIEWELGLRERMIGQELESADRLLVPSRAQEVFLRTIWAGPMSRLEIVPLGSHLAGPEGADRAEPRATGGPTKIGYWGYLLPEKGVHLLLEAGRRLSKERAVEWHIFGVAPRPEYQARLVHLAEGLPVAFHGNYGFHQLQAADLDLAVFPSLCCETHSFVLDEAFQLGLPVLASNRGAFCERVGEAGLLFECGNVGDLAAKLESVLESRTVLRRLRQAVAERRVVSMDDHVRRMEKIYQEVVDSYEPAAAQEQEYREILLHQHQQMIDRDRELQGLRRDLQAAQDRLLELEGEEARLRQKVATLEEEREWWKRQTKALEDELGRITKMPLHRLVHLLSKFK